MIKDAQHHYQGAQVRITHEDAHHQTNVKQKECRQECEGIGNSALLVKMRTGPVTTENSTKVSQKY